MQPRPLNAQSPGSDAGCARPEAGRDAGAFGPADVFIADPAPVFAPPPAADLACETGPETGPETGFEMAEVGATIAGFEATDDACVGATAGATFGTGWMAPVDWRAKAAFVRENLRTFAAWFDRHAALILLVAVTSLLALGVVLIFSASAKVAMESRVISDPAFFLKKHLIFLGVSLFGCVAAFSVSHDTLKRRWKLIFGIALAMLVAVLIPGIGTEFNGARRWFRFGFFGFQPSDFAKLALVVALAAHLSRPDVRRRLADFTRGFLPFVAIVAPVVGLVVLEPDFGTTLFLCACSVIVFIAAGGRLKHVFLAVVPLVVLLAIVVVVKFDHVRPRIEAFLDPNADPLGKGYQVRQSLIALGAGGPMGVGLGQSRQAMWYLPEESTDFIFAILGEELGFLGSSFALLAYLVLVVAGLRIAATCRDRFGQLLAVGLTLLIGLQAAINVAVVTASVPNKGIALPFISFGGSLTFFYLIAVGLILGVARQTAPAFALATPPPDGPLDPHDGEKSKSSATPDTARVPKYAPVPAGRATAVLSPVGLAMSAPRTIPPTLAIREKEVWASKAAEETLEMPAETAAALDAEFAATSPRLRLSVPVLGSVDAHAVSVVLPITEKIAADETPAEAGAESGRKQTLLEAGPADSGEWIGETLVLAIDELVIDFDTEPEVAPAAEPLSEPLSGPVSGPLASGESERDVSVGALMAQFAALDAESLDDLDAMPIGVLDAEPQVKSMAAATPADSGEWAALDPAFVTQPISPPALAYVPASDAGDSTPRLFAVPGDELIEWELPLDVLAAPAPTAADVGGTTEIEFEPPPDFSHRTTRVA